MTDKEIIIDGVDVSGCCYAILPKNQCPAKIMPYAKETSCIACKEHNTKLNFCKNNPNCYFKQLQRKTAECEELKKEKAEIKKYFGIDSKTILERLEELQERRDELSEKNISYEQALDSIVATIKDLENENIVTFPDFSLKENCKIIMGQCNKGYVDILNIINKAKDGQ